jgi:hypothetical protein
MALDILKLRALQPPAGLGFKIRRLGYCRVAGHRLGTFTAVLHASFGI